jgi:hypothetical protein
VQIFFDVGIQRCQNSLQGNPARQETKFSAVKQALFVANSHATRNIIVTAFNPTLADVVSLVSMWAINFSIVPDVTALFMFLIWVSVYRRII